VAPTNELVIVHPGGLSVSCWSRLASLLPAGTAVRVHELETHNAFWSADERLTTAGLAVRLRITADSVIAGWGVGGAVAEALGARTRARHIVVLDGLAPGAPAPDETELLRRFAMYLGARRGVDLGLAPLELGEIVRRAREMGALPASSSSASVRRCYREHVRRELRDHRLGEAHEPSGEPLTVVKAARSLGPDQRALGWDRFGAVEVLGSAGDHYSMLTDRASTAHLAMLLARWLIPARLAA
jgi:thioesterase domain-containing protein